MFSNLDTEEAKILPALSETQNYEPPAKLWSIGEHSNFFLVLLDGSLHSLRPNGEIFFEIGPDEVMGMAMFLRVTSVLLI